MIALRAFAIGFGRWVELRTASVPPEGKTTTFKMKVDGFASKWVGGDFDGHYVRTPKKIEKRFSCTVFEGGKVEGVVTANRFRYVTGFNLSKDSITEIPKEYIPVLLKEE